VTGSSRSRGSTEGGERAPDAVPVLAGLRRGTVANALLVGGVLAVPLAFLGLGRIPNRLLWTVVGTGLLAAAVGFLAAPRARIAWLAPLQRSLLFDRSDAELRARATMAYLFVGMVLLALAGWVLFHSTKI
jgi:hypothetical protein